MEVGMEGGMEGKRIERGEEQRGAERGGLKSFEIFIVPKKVLNKIYV